MFTQTPTCRQPHGEEVSYCVGAILNLSTTRLDCIAMDYLKDVSKNINLYDVKAYVRKAQNGM